MKFFKKLLSAALSTTMIFSSVAVSTVPVSAAPSISAGWNETLYAEWADSNPDSEAVKIGYKLSSETEYTYLTGNDLTYLVRPSSTSGYGRVDIPGLKAGRYDIYIKASDGTEHTRKGIKVYEYDRSGYAHFNYNEGIGGYNNDGTPKDNAIIVYVTDENKDTVEVPGYEGRKYDYHSNSFNVDYTRTCEGVGNILNNNMKFIQDVTITDNHPLIIRFIGKVNVPKNLTPYNTKDAALGGSKGDNGNLAITKYARNITIEGIGDDATIDGWGFTFSQTSTCPVESGKSFEVRNLTFKNYTEDGLGFQGDDPITCPIERVWVHNNVFYPGYCANPAESDKAEGDGSCDFKRGQYYTMAYNHYIDCHKTNLLGAGDSNDQFYMTLHHNWYQNVASRQPLAAGGNVHIYNTYFDNAKSQTIDLRGKAACFSEANYFENCKNAYKSRKATANIKTYNDILAGSTTIDDIKGTKIVAATRDESGIPDNGLTFPDGGSMKDYDTNPKYFYYNTATKTTNVSVLNDAADVPEYVKTYAGVLKAFPETESGEIIITVKSGNTPLTDASVVANGLTFKNNGDGTYSATASLGAEYVITVSKEGYSNKVITSTVLNNDGDMFTATADLPVDYDGFAVIKLTGGSENTPVKGATVTLTNGTVLTDQGDGTYKSAEQIAVGSYTATITNTGDYIAPSAPVNVTVKTTDAATEIHLDKIKGVVSVTLTAADDETQEFNPTGATVYAGSTQLNDSGNGVFTGNVDINTPLDIYVNLPGWSVESITPNKLTATKDGTATATAVLRYKGQLYTWNYTEGINTEEFFSVTANDWSSASGHSQTYDGETLSKAVKMESSTLITFTAPSDGDLAVVLYRSSAPTIKIDGTTYDCQVGTTIIPIKAGAHTITKGSSSTYLYLLQYAGGGIDDNPNPPTPVTTVTTTEAVSETTTEGKTEETTFAVPVELGEAVTNSGAGISVTYNEANNTWSLTDSSSALAAELNIPFVTPITSGKVVVSGTATPSTASGKWSFVKILGPNGADGTATEVAALATDANKMITLRTDGANYASSTALIAANKTYNYKFIIDMDAKTVTLNIDGTEYKGAFTASEITGFGSITSVSGSRNITVSNPYVAVISEKPIDEVLNDEIIWDVTNDIAEGSNGLTVGDTFYTNSEENGPIDFVYNGKTYQLGDWVQPNTNPIGADGFNPMNSNGIPVSGGFVKFEPTADGVFTMAVKTNGGKITYVTDENGSVVMKIDNTDGSTRYDIARLNVAAGKSYHIFAVGSKTCLYYIGYTAGITVPTENTTEITTETTTEGTTEGTTEEQNPDPVKVYGDVNSDGKVDISDVSMLLDLVLNDKAEVKAGITDVNKDNKVDTADVATILQKVLDNSWKMPCEPDETETTTANQTTETTTETTTAEQTTKATTEATTAEQTTKSTEATTAEQTTKATTEATTAEQTTKVTEATTEATTAEQTTKTTEATTSEVTTENTNNDSYYDFNDSPVITKDGTSGITYTVSTKEGTQSDGLAAEAVIADNGGSKAIYINDASATDTVKVTLPMTEKTSGKVIYTAKITPSILSTKWTIMQLNGLKADGVTEGEVLGIRTADDKTNAYYGLRVNAGAVLTPTSVNTAANTQATIVITVDFDNDTATLSVNGSAPVSVTGVDAKSITSMSFQTATAARSLYIDDAGITDKAEEPSTEITTGEASTEDTTTAPIPSGSYVHNFTSDGINSTFYTISGKLANDKGTVIYNGMTLTQCLKMETATNIKFTAPTAGTLTLVFNAADAKHNCKVDGTKLDSDANGIVTVNLTAGAHEVTKRDASNLYYMVFTPAN